MKLGHAACMGGMTVGKGACNVYSASAFFLVFLPSVLFVEENGNGKGEGAVGTFLLWKAKRSEAKRCDASEATFRDGDGAQGLPGWLGELLQVLSLLRAFWGLQSGKAMFVALCLHCLMLLFFCLGVLGVFFTGVYEARCKIFLLGG